MRLIAVLCLGFVLTVRPNDLQSARPKHGVGTLLPAAGVKTPGVLIRFASLKPEVEFAAPSKPDWIALANAVWFPDAAHNALNHFDPKSKEAKLEAVTGISRPCGGLVQAFGSIWTTSCAEQAIVRIDPKTSKVIGKLAFGADDVPGTIAATSDSVWVLTDTKTTLSRIDPEEGKVVAELRLPAGCRSLIVGEGSLWAACPAEDKVLRINPATLQVEKAIEVAGGPQALCYGENSVWSLGRREGKLDRIDPKLNKVAKTIDLRVPNAAGGLAAGEGAIWVTLAGFPVSRVDPQSETVAQQFYGEGGGAIQAGSGFVWLSNLSQGTLWKIDPKRIRATLAE